MYNSTVVGVPYSLGCACRDKPHSLEPISCPPVGEGPTVDLRLAARLWSLKAAGQAGAEGPGGSGGMARLHPTRLAPGLSSLLTLTHCRNQDGDKGPGGHRNVTISSSFLQGCRAGCPVTFPLAPLSGDSFLPSFLLHSLIPFNKFLLSTCCPLGVGYTDDLGNLCFVGSLACSCTETTAAFSTISIHVPFGHSPLIMHLQDNSND